MCITLSDNGDHKNRHERIHHTKEKPFPTCILCEKTFSDSGNKTIGMKSNTQVNTPKINFSEAIQSKMYKPLRFIEITYQCA